MEHYSVVKNGEGGMYRPRYSPYSSHRPAPVWLQGRFSMVQVSPKNSSRQSRALMDVVMCCQMLTR